MLSFDIDYAFYHILTHLSLHLITHFAIPFDFNTIFALLLLLHCGIVIVIDSDIPIVIVVDPNITLLIPIVPFIDPCQYHQLLK